MNYINRRNFMRLGGLATMSAFCGSPGNLYASNNIRDLQTMHKAVKFTRDGLDLTPLEYTHLLKQFAEEGKIKTDVYSLGGIVEELENRFARWLGKESAIFMPTGTLANHIAVRKLTGKKRRVIVQADSHIYNDSGDCCQSLSGLNLLPLAPSEKGFTLDEVKRVISETAVGRVSTSVGAISIESPVRRRNNQMFDLNEMQKISSYAREQGIKLHLDGARIFIASAHTGINPSQYAVHFDTVYTSLYKCFNAASGAILAGSKKFIENLFHTRRMFGGGMPQVWTFAAVALHYVNSFIGDYKRALIVADRFMKTLQQSSAFYIEKIPNGTNVFKLYVSGNNLDQFRSKLRQKNIYLPPPREDGKGFLLKINTTLNRTNGENLPKQFIQSLT